MQASNIITYKDEIMARPARSWFQTEKERSATKESAKAEQPTSARVVADLEAKPEDSWIKKVRRRWGRVAGGEAWWVAGCGWW